MEILPHSFSAVLFYREGGENLDKRVPSKGVREAGNSHCFTTMFFLGGAMEGARKKPLMPTPGAAPEFQVLNRTLNSPFAQAF